MEKALHSLNKYSEKIKRIDKKLSSISWEYVNAKNTRDFDALKRLNKEKDKLKFMHNDTVSVCNSIIKDFNIPTLYLKDMVPFEEIRN